MVYICARTKRATSPFSSGYIVCVCVCSGEPLIHHTHTLEKLHIYRDYTTFGCEAAPSEWSREWRRADATRVCAWITQTTRWRCSPSSRVLKYTHILVRAYLGSTSTIKPPTHPHTPTPTHTHTAHSHRPTATTTRGSLHHLLLCAVARLGTPAPRTHESRRTNGRMRACVRVHRVEAALCCQTNTRCALWPPLRNGGRAPCCRSDQRGSGSAEFWRTPFPRRFEEHSFAQFILLYTVELCTWCVFIVYDVWLPWTLQLALPLYRHKSWV